TPEVIEEALSASSYVLMDLLPERTYYWRVQAVNSSDTSPFSSVYSFSTTQAPPAAGVLISPEAGAEGLPTTVALEWETIDDADSYHLQMDTAASFPAPVLEITDLSSTSYEAGDLQRETQYFWRVRGMNRGGSGAWSPVSSFTTVIFPPAAPDLQNPADNSVGVPTTISLSWSGSAEDFSVQLATDQLFQSIVVDRQDLDTTALDVGGLTHDREHFWRVRGTNAGGSGAWSQFFSFTTIVAAPSSPGLLSPENHAENVPVPTFLDWTDVSGATAYDIQVSQSNKFDNLVVDTSEVTESGLEVRTLRNKEIYFWRARAVNAGGKSAWSTAQTFDTQTA
ncbi:MAG: fibronectin type III domain-containing protein, partial [Rhodothermales bacterium]